MAYDEFVSSGIWRFEHDGLAGKALRVLQRLDLGSSTNDFAVLGTIQCPTFWDYDSTLLRFGLAICLCSVLFDTTLYEASFMRSLYESMVGGGMRKSRLVAGVTAALKQGGVFWGGRPTVACLLAGRFAPY